MPIMANEYFKLVSSAINPINGGPIKKTYKTNTRNDG
jgi:hypothetical protein